MDDRDALRALAEIRSATGAMKGVRGAFFGAYHFLVWGPLCLLGFAATQFHAVLPPWVVPAAWAGVNVLGFAGSLAVGARMRGTFREPGQGRAALLWPLLLPFGAALALVARPGDPAQGTEMALLFTAMWMAALGLWTRSQMLPVGVAIAALSLFGYFALPDWFWLWSGFAVCAPMLVGAALGLRSARRSGPPRSGGKPRQADSTNAGGRAP